MTVDCYIDFDAINCSRRPGPDLKQRGPEAPDNYCNKLDVVRAQTVTDTDTGTLVLSLALPLRVGVPTEVKAEVKAKARVVVNTGTIHGCAAQQYFDIQLSDTPISFWEEPSWLPLGSSSFTAWNGRCVVALQDSEPAVW